MIDRHRATFRDEAQELLAEIEECLLLLEDRPDDRELVGRLFRAMHTIKGSGAMLGFDAIAAFTHDLENAFDLVRKGELALTAEILGLALRARDRIAAMLAYEDGVDPAGAAEAAEITTALRALLPSAAAPARPAKAATPREAPQGGAEITYRIRFRPAPDTLRHGGDPAALVDELRAFGRAAVTLITDDVPGLADIDPEACHVSWNVVLATSRPLAEVEAVFLFTDPEEVRIERIADAVSEAATPRIGDILVQRGDIDRRAVEDAAARQKRMTELLLEEGKLTPGAVHAALQEQRVLREQQAKGQLAEHAASIRVPVERLDALVNLVGELVTVQARFSQTASKRGEAELLTLAEEVERLTWALRDNAMNVRMLPIGETFGRLKRLVHDLARDLGKQVTLVAEGAETELDKTVIDRLADPLVHVIRNAIDHGIEAPAARAASGKPAAGVVRLAARHSGASVLIEIGDDGAGLDVEAIRAKALARGLIAPTAEITPRELYNLILLPGFSTATTVTSVSGRGVGMDVVRQALDALGGSIEIDSVRGAGTTFTIKLPLTLAIIDGLLVELGSDAFILPLAAVQECIELTADDVAKSCGRDIVAVRGQIVPYIRLRETFGTGGERPPIEQVVIAETGGQRVGFVVDRIVGQHQTVIKSLGRVYRGVPGISGSTILGDGSVALILDPPKLIARAVEAERAMSA